MTIVAKEDNRNASWSHGSIGAKLLTKMGWSEGEGLGRHKQGTSNALRAIRRAEGLGIGATQDSTGSQGWNTTNDSFASVLAHLKVQHANESTTTTTTTTTTKQQTRKRKRTKELTLAQNRVVAGHSKKMRAAKQLTNKTPEEMACIFGGSVQQYTPAVVVVVVTAKETRTKKRSKLEEDDKQLETTTATTDSDKDKQERKKSKKQKKTRDAYR